MKYILSGLALLTVLLVVVLVVVKRRKSSSYSSSQTSNDAPSPSPNYNSGGGSTSIDMDKVLSLGSRGGEVELLQKGMNEEITRLATMYVNLQPVAVDGNFGPQTEATLESLTGKKSISLRQALQLLDKAYS